MKPYPKIDTLFERNPDFTVDPEKIKRPVLGTIGKWRVTEKVDGMNMRVECRKDGSALFAGRSDNAQIPGDLVQYLRETFTEDRVKVIFSEESDPDTVVTLYGEGYGAGIQRGVGYGPTKRFILFDVLVTVGGKDYWLPPDEVLGVATRLGIDSVPFLGELSLQEIVYSVKQGIPSQLGPLMAEGIVAQPIEPLFDRRGNRIVIKLKTSDFLPGRR